MTTATAAPIATATAAGMAATVDRNTLRDALKSVLPAVCGKTTLPILSTVAITATEEGLTLRATTLDIEVSVAVEAEVAAEGAITVPVKRLAKLLHELPTGPLELAGIGDRDPKLEVRCPSAAYHLVGHPIEDMPNPPAVEPTHTFAIAAATLFAMSRHTTHCAYTDIHRPILQGAYLHEQDGALHMVATNGHRMGWATTDLPEGAEGVEALLYPAALDAAIGVFSAEDDVVVEVGASYARIRTDYAAVTSRNIEGPYPNFRQVFPKSGELKHRAVVEAKQLRNVLRRALVVASDQTWRLVLHLGADEFRVMSDTPDLGSSSAFVPATVSGDGLRIGFNGQYLVEILNQLGGEVSLEMVSPERATVITHTDERPVSAKYLLMPLRLLE